MDSVITIRVRGIRLRAAREPASLADRLAGATDKLVVAVPKKALNLKDGDTLEVVDVGTAIVVGSPFDPWGAPAIAGSEQAAAKMQIQHINSGKFAAMLVRIA